MTDSIQPLLERIQNEGLKKSEAEREKILSDATVQAEKTIADAQQQAEKIITDAEQESKALLSRGQTALEQASRDLLLKLRTELSRQLNVAAQSAAAGSLSSEELLNNLLPLLAASGSGRVTVEAGSEMSETLKRLLPSLLRDAGKEGEVVMNPKTGAGFRLSFAESAEAIDFSTEAIADWISQYVRPELAALLKSEETGA